MVPSLNPCDGMTILARLLSCGEYLKTPCVNICGSERCEHFNNYVKDHAYKVLEKLCCKAFKRFNRIRCRELYTVFDGGNSINVLINPSYYLGRHKAGIRSCTDGHPEWKQPKLGQNDERPTQTIGDGNGKKVSKSNNDSQVKDNIDYTRNGRKDRERIQLHDGKIIKSVASTKNQNDSQKDGRHINDDDNDKLQDQEEKYTQRKEKRTVKQAHDENATEKVTNGKTYGNHKKRQKTRPDENNAEENKKLSQNDNQKLLQKDNQSTGKMERTSKSEEDTYNISVHDKRFETKNDAKRSSLKKKADDIKKYRKPLTPTNKHPDLIVSDLHKINRQGTRVFFNDVRTDSARSTNAERVTNQGIESLQRRVPMRRRADEAKPCDFLRAHMEERDQCICSYRSQKLSYPSTPCTCSKFCVSFHNEAAPCGIVQIPSC